MIRLINKSFALIKNMTFISKSANKENYIFHIHKTNKIKIVKSEKKCTKFQRFYRSSKLSSAASLNILT